ncbi:hypothetical protein RF371_00785 [Companilactobacillus paralimentarius]|uniref:hypothetical protein n=1 Tax=Companilactobacillus paralimentarius TaxID=83526 RepID=UPI002853154C|nr:hypothetical protein [Companilactobacillus paralimentarius]MDR4932386.1 hypothetical protein [Companilactobacillus paralimentarius]
MKKSIKYAGIAAATLLAVAPVAAPVVSTVSETTVKAATNATYTNAADANVWLNQFADKTYATDAKIPSFGLTVGNNQSLSADAVASDPLIKDAQVSTANENNTFAKATDTKITSVQVYAIDANGNVDSSAMSQSDVNTRLANRLGGGVQVQLGYSYKTSADAAAATGTKTINFKYAKAAATTSVTKAAATYTTPISVEAGSKVANTQLQSSLNVSLKDQNGKELVGNTDEVASVTPSNQYFTTLKAAEVSATKGDADVTSGTFKANTTYYQRITLKATKGSALDTYLAAQAKTADGSYTINGISYANTNNGAIVAATDGATVTFVRTINAGSTEAAGWTTTDTTGVVTTKTAHNYYTLKNDDNQTIANRALGANTPWRTDKVRTNANGEKQYRVATGEWIDADDVVYSNGNDNNSNNGSGLTDIKTVSGVATLTKAKGYFMALFNDEGKAYDNKYLGSPSAWRVDRTAKGADGKTYYRVATSEWLQAGEGVSFK